MIAATPLKTESTPPDQRFVFYGLSWDQYEAMLDALGDRRLRHTYVEGALEIVSPSMFHESSKSVLGGLVKMLCRILKLPHKSIGSTTTRLELEFEQWVRKQVLESRDFGK